MLWLGRQGTSQCVLFRRVPHSFVRQLLSLSDVSLGSAQHGGALALNGALVTSYRGVISASTMMDHPPYKFRQQHTYRTLPLHDANRFGGRTAYLREIGPFDHKRRGRLFKRQRELSQWNVDVWAAQQSLRKKWKSRDYFVVEMPFLQSPQLLQRVIPEVFTDVPICLSDNQSKAEECSTRDPSSSSVAHAVRGANHASRAYHVPEDRYHRQHTCNLRQRVFSLEELQLSLFGGVSPYPPPRVTSSTGDCGTTALNNFL